ncbi:BlaI/MecI/CopY family transcriptional regulator [Bryobacter aggregatus]|uniref:BlaI/MecI/CopY family transcriptional regulator n=1 Tax=Bryobacter aggregatus TaxID=360054 RepID=UPI0004E1A1E9|nr:BlaI/MecI/CopY family transcriptional regulator [Bryobacter aggregatus]
MKELSRRERELMEILLRRGKLTAQEIREELADGSSYSTVRTLLRILAEKGHILAKLVEGRYEYEAAQSKDRAARASLKSLLATFYENSAEKAMAALLDQSASRMSREELDRLAQMIDEARKGARK